MFRWIQRHSTAKVYCPAGHQAFLFVYVPRWIPKSVAIMATIEMANVLTDKGHELEGYGIESLDFVKSVLPGGKKVMCHSYRFDRLVVGEVDSQAA